MVNHYDAIQDLQMEIEQLEVKVRAFQEGGGDSDDRGEVSVASTLG